MTTFACTDLHGNREAWEWVKSHLQEDDELIFLGDAIDRGDDSYAIMKELLEDARVTYICGNHEDMFIRSMRAFARLLREEFTGYTIHDLKHTLNIKMIMDMDEDMALHMSNGGLITMRAWINDGAPMTLIRKLAALPTHISYKNYDLCHAGCTTSDWEKDRYAMIWDRSHFLCAWFAGRTLVHGHTPICFMPEPILMHEGMPYNGEEITGPINYFPGLLPEREGEDRGRKINLDTGAVFTDLVSLLNLDTGEIMTCQM